jgi:hypothetical protein
MIFKNYVFIVYDFVLLFNYFLEILSNKHITEVKIMKKVNRTNYITNGFRLYLANSMGFDPSIKWDQIFIRFCQTEYP